MFKITKYNSNKKNPVYNRRIDDDFYSYIADRYGLSDQIRILKFISSITRVRGKGTVYHTIWGNYYDISDNMYSQEWYGSRMDTLLTEEDYKDFVYSYPEESIF